MYALDLECKHACLLLAGYFACQEDPHSRTHRALVQPCMRFDVLQGKLKTCQQADEVKGMLLFTRRRAHILWVFLGNGLNHSAPTNQLTILEPYC